MSNEMTPATLAGVGVHTPMVASSDPLMAASPVNIRARVQAIQQVMASVMKPETHYGIVPGAKKPSLFKPGAEVLCMTFGLSARITTRITGDHPDIPYHWKDRKKEYYDGPRGRAFNWVDEEGDTPGYFEVVATCEICGPDGRLLTGVEGSCNNREKKYRTLNVYETRNTVMKMAGKRAYVAAVLMATGASDMFSQDLLDEEEGRPASDPSTHPSAQAQPQPQASWMSEPQKKLIYAKAKKASLGEDVAKHMIETLNGLAKPKGKPVFDAIADGKPEAEGYWKRAKEGAEKAKSAATEPPPAQNGDPGPQAPEGAQSPDPAE